MNNNIKLIIGLGNPCKEYATTRHNAGAWWLKRLCEQQKIELQSSKKFKGLLTRATIYDKDVYCFISNSYMNLSGQAVFAVSNYYNIQPKEILIVHDDLDLLAGTVRLKIGGGHGGHNGLKDIISVLKTEDFLRLRLGIGHPGNKDLVSDYVLQVPNKIDKYAINDAIDRSLLELPDIIKGNFTIVMDHLHKP